MNVIRVLNIILSFIGIGVCIYAYYVKTTKLSNPKYEAMCDISERMSCSKVLTSPFGKGFGLVQHFVGEDSCLIQPNSVYGFFYFTAQIILGEVKSIAAAKFQAATNSVAFLCCIYLAYLLYYVLEDLCLVCVTTYILIISLFIVSLIRVLRMKKMARKDSTRPAQKIKKK